MNLITPKALYIRIPKNGSISMFGVIRRFPQILSKSRRYYPTEINNPIGLGKEYLESFGPIDLSKLFIYSFVRNPFSRAVSSWRFTSYKKGESFEDFCRNLSNTSEWHSFEQWIYLYDKNNNSVTDYIGRIESYQDDFNYVCDQTGIPQQELIHKNPTKHKHYTEYYNKETRDLVSQKYAKDIDLFGYKFGE